ncbi:hypothetical protein [Verminephrobacter aporrectodeae]|uniref:hypothetical protein n=1 Tax=Verminephrobacter aporrectodeae TaxID=1110389 RepID=UPI0022388B73|nr:hypothetical protein [Verminephrobacter aporrectodeae]
MADAILVQVTPDAQVGKNAVCRIDLAVVIGIQVFECVKAVGCQLAIALERVHTKEFATRIDRAIAISVQHQPAVVGFDPSSAGFDAIGVVIEQDDRTVAGAGGFDAVAIQIENQRVTARRFGSARTRITTSASYATRSPSSTTAAATTTLAAGRTMPSINTWICFKVCNQFSII